MIRPSNAAFGEEKERTGAGTSRLSLLSALCTRGGWISLRGAYATARTSEAASPRSLVKLVKIQKDRPI